jgi:hypothetical protein
LEVVERGKEDVGEEDDLKEDHRVGKDQFQGICFVEIMPPLLVALIHFIKLLLQ